MAAPIAPIQAQRRSCLIISLILLAVVLAGAGGVYAFFRFGIGNIINAKINPDSAISVAAAAHGEPIGISDGRYAFDTTRTDKDLKLQASDKFKQGDVTDAESLWEKAIAQDTNDAEALIYLEDQQVRDSGVPYITLIVGTALTGNASNISTGRDNLQGAYVAQKEYNDGQKISGATKLILLIANAGGKPEYATTVARQVVQLAQQDSHVVGVMGWPFSSYALNAVDVLAAAKLPMVSPTASSDSLTGVSPFFFRIVPPNKSQAVLGAQYAEQQLHARSAAVFLDPNDPYSSSLANNFSQRFTDDGNQIVAKEQYTAGKPDPLPGLLQDALSKNPDLVYFAGYASDMGALLANFPKSQSNVQLMGGDGLYELGGYSVNAQSKFSGLYFTAFAYPDEWDNQNMGSQKPEFFTRYADDFDPQRKHQGSPYGYTRSDNDAMLSYDATVALLEGSKNALANSKAPFTPQALQQSLAKITGANAIQGVSGQIAFGSDGDPINKAVVILYVTNDGHITFKGIQGCFLKASCNS